MKRLSLHYRITQLATWLGPGNAGIRFLIRRQCRRHGVTIEFKKGQIALTKNNHSVRISPPHFVYAADIASHFGTYFDAVEPKTIDGLSVVDFSKPSLHTYKRLGIEFELAAFPEEEDAIEAYFRWYRPQPDDLTFDVGAHCGVSAYFISKLVGPKGRVIAFEPDPLNYSILMRNIARHNLHNVTPVKAAIADTRGKAPFNCEGAIGSALSDHTSRASAGTVEFVDAMTLSDAFEKFGTPAFCKMDIEGAEIGVIASSTALLRENTTHFALDTNHVINGALTNARVERGFTDGGYIASSESIDGFMTTWARPR